MITNSSSGTNVHEVATGIYRINTPVALPGVPGGFNFNQYLIVDGDTGFGNALNVQRTVRGFERAGAANGERGIAASRCFAQGIEVERVNKVAQGRPHIVDKIKDGEIHLIFNTTEGWQSLKDSEEIRRSALVGKVSQYTTAAGSIAVAQAIAALQQRQLEVRPLQDYY